MVFQQIVNSIVLGGIYALVALGFTMMFGISRIGNFAHGEVLMIGSYLTLIGVTYLHINFFIALVCSMAAMGLLGIAMERIVFRPVLNRPMLNTFLVSIGLMIFLNNVAILLFGTNTKTIPFPIGGTVSFFGVILSYQRLLMLFVTIVLIAALYFILRHTGIGRAVRALSQDKEGAQVVGINFNRINGFIFAVSGALAAAAGAIMGSLFSVEPNMGFAPLLKAFTVVVLGGLGSTLGAAVGGLILGTVEVMSSSYISAAYSDVFGFAIMIVVLLVRPSGLFGREE